MHLSVKLFGQSQLFYSKTKWILGVNKNIKWLGVLLGISVSSLQRGVPHKWILLLFVGTKIPLYINNILYIYIYGKYINP